jgi:pimeloyl-ACP methyl ester carboxylesterase
MGEAPPIPAVVLADGRRLAYGDWGNPQGFAVVSCHGGLSSGLDVAVAADAARRAGVRLIAPDRPGIGGSTRQPGRDLLGWPADVAELTDALDLERFAVMGWSLGGAYAAACAFALPDRVAGLALIASIIPLDRPGALNELNRMDRSLLRLCAASPTVARAAFRAFGLAARLAPGRQARATAAGLRNPAGVVDDYRVFGAPWGFAPADVRTPTQVWQGDADRLVEPEWGRRLSDELPDATLTVWPGGRHLPSSDRYGEVVAGLARVDRNRARAGG